MQHNKYKWGASAFAILLLLCLSSIELAAQQYGNFPFQATFLYGNVPDDVVRPNPSKNSATFETNGLQLTPAEEGKFGAIYLNDHKFKAELGIFIEFEYMVYDGTGGDGFCVFFFDANEPSPNIGASGAGLGYTYNRTPYNTSTSGLRAEGLRGAYLGIGFDSYGNFSGMRYQGESRVQGIPYSYYSSSGTAAFRMNGNNEVTLRGGRRTTAITNSGVAVPGMGIGYAGYPVLVSQRTNEGVGFILSEDQTTPKYVLKNQLKAPNYFDIRGGEEFDRPTDDGYRKAYIEMFPNGETGANEGFFISVMIEGKNSRDTVIYDYNYKAQTYYYENAYNGPAGDNQTDDSFDYNASRRRLDINLPIELKIGFAASTGTSAGGTPGSQGKTDRHVIKNVGIRLPRSAEAHDDFLDDRYQGTGSVIFEPLLNDLAYNGVISRDQVPSPDNIDPITFKFVAKNDDVPSNQYQLVVPNEGTWTYDPTTEKVTFEPEPGFLGQARVRYIIKGKNDGIGPYHDDAFYSIPATIGVDIIVNPNPGRNTVTNKMATMKLN